MNSFLKDIIIDSWERGGNPEDIFLVVESSGTTGPCKGVILSRGAVEDNALKVAALHDMANQKHGTSLPLTHCNAICMSVMGAHLSGGESVILDWEGPDKFFEDLDREEVVTANVVPTQVYDIVRARPPWPKN